MCSLQNLRKLVDLENVYFYNDRWSGIEGETFEGKCGKFQCHKPFEVEGKENREREHKEAAKIMFSLVRKTMYLTKHLATLIALYTNIVTDFFFSWIKFDQQIHSFTTLF